MAKSIVMTRNIPALVQWGGGTMYAKQIDPITFADLSTADDMQVLPIIGDNSLEDDWKTVEVDDADGHVYPVDDKRLVKVILNVKQRDINTLNFNQVFSKGKMFRLLIQLTSDVSGTIGGKNEYAYCVAARVEKTAKLKMKFSAFMITFWLVDNPAADTGLTVNDITTLATCVPVPLATLVATDGATAAHLQYTIFEK